MRPMISLLALATISASTSACSLHFFDRWDADVIRSAEVARAPADLWDELHASARDAGLLLAGTRAEARTLEFDWLATTGDGAAYLDCAGNGAVGSASLRPRVTLVETARGTRVDVSSLVHATAASDCTSNGHFEDWLLQRLRIGGADDRIATTPSVPSPD